MHRAYIFSVPIPIQLEYEQRLFTIYYRYEISLLGMNQSNTEPVMIDWYKIGF